MNKLYTLSALKEDL